MKKIWLDKYQRKHHPEYKYCEGCWDYWHKSEFARSTHWPDGLQKQCKICNPSGIEIIPKVYANICVICGRTENMATDLNPWTCYYCSLSPEKKALHDDKQAFYEENKRLYKEMYRAKKKQRIEALPDYVKDGATDWELSKWHKCGLRTEKERKRERQNLLERMSRATRQARLLGAPTNYTWEKWMQKVAFYGWKCVYCGKELNYKTLTCDHFKPLKDAGTHYIGNLVPACRPCNSSKHTSRWKINHRVTCRQIGT